MRLTRVYVEAALTGGTRGLVSGNAANHIVRVLRLGVGDALTLFDGRGGEYAARIEALKKEAVQVAVGEHVATERESPLAVTLAQGVSRGERMDWVMQKATELGVQRIVPLITKRSVVRWIRARRRRSCSIGAASSLRPANSAAGTVCLNWRRRVICRSSWQRGGSRSNAHSIIARGKCAHRRDQACKEAHGIDWAGRRACARGGASSPRAGFRGRAIGAEGAAHRDRSHRSPRRAAAGTRRSVSAVPRRAALCDPAQAFTNMSFSATRMPSAYGTAHVDAPEREGGVPGQ